MARKGALTGFGGDLSIGVGLMRSDDLCAARLETRLPSGSSISPASTSSEEASYLNADAFMSDRFRHMLSSDREKGKSLGCIVHVMKFQFHGISLSLSRSDNSVCRNLSIMKAAALT